MDLILCLALDAAIMGVIVVAVAGGPFPGWGPMVGCALAVGFTSGAVAFFLPDALSFLGLIAGAGVGALMLAWLLEISTRRALIASSIYLGVRVALTLAAGLVLA